MGSGPSKIQKKAKSKLSRFIDGIEKQSSRIAFENQERNTLYEILLAREKLTDEIDKMSADKKIPKSDIMNFIEENMDSFEKYNNTIRSLTRKYGGKPNFVIRDLLNERICDYELEIRKKLAQRSSQQQFGAGSSTFEKMSRKVTGLFNSTKSKNQTAAEDLIKKHYRSAGMGDDARRANVMNLVKQRMDALDAKNSALAETLNNEIVNALSKDGLGNPMTPPTSTWWNTSFGRRKSFKRKNSFGKQKKWSVKYKRSINCKRPKGFSQKQYCKYGRKK